MPGINVPQTEQILKAMDVGETSTEAADYLVERFTKILAKAKMLDSCQDIVKKVEDYAKFVHFKLTSAAQPWSGVSNQSSDFKNMQENLAVDAVQNLKDSIKGLLSMDIAISRDAELLRGYSAGGKEMDAIQVEAMDKLFNSWLADKNIISQDSMLYEVDEQGEIKLDDRGEKVKPDPQELKALMNDSDKGFASYLKSKDKDVAITIQQHEYPSATPEESVRNTPGESPGQ